MLRALAALLVVANLLFFGWARGWFAPGLQPPRHGEREPERLMAQVRPETVTVLPANAASAAVTAARAAAAQCLEAGPIADADLAAAEAVLTTVQGSDSNWTRETAPPPPLWLVYAGRVPDAAQRRVREEELRRLGAAFEVIDAPAELAPGLVVSRHATRAAAEAALAAWAASAASAAGQPVKGAAAAQTLKAWRVVALPAPPPRHWLRIAKADADVQARLAALPAAALAGGFRACAPRP